MTQDDGGPAFPTESRDEFIHGMSLRDWFAGLALQSIYPVVTERDRHQRTGMVKEAYDIADAMLEERKR